ncbi:MAG: GEVED domain-containing protein, partial [Litorimonas sp.]
ARFRINFFVSGTNTPIEIDFAASAIDVDGNQNAPTVTGLRELAEFENGFVESLLNSATELLTNASGPTPGFTRFQSETDQFAPGIDETAENNIVTVFYTDVSEIEYIIGTVGNGGGTRLTSLGFNCPNLSSPIASPIIDEDFGDAPSTYGNPIHTLVNNIRLGGTNTADAGPFNSSTASADNGDDGVTIPPFTETSNATIIVNVVGAGGFLQGWVDWNGDGDFNDPDEQIAINVQDTDNNGIIEIPVAVPSSTTTGQTFARFRWSTSSGIATNTAVSDGEVEDYLISPITQAVVNLTAVKSVEVFDSGNASSYMIPGNEVLYRIIVTNEASSTAEAQAIDLSDTLPENVRFISATTTGFTNGTFGTPDLPTTNTDCTGDACVIRFSGATLPIDTIGEVQVRALIK